MLAALLGALKSTFLYETKYQEGQLLTNSEANSGTFNAAVRGSFYRYITTHNIELCDHYNHESGKCPQLLEMFNAGFYRGAQYSIKVSGELSPYIARFIEFMMWITEDRTDAEQLGFPDV